MCYGDPVELLAKLIAANPLVPDRLGHTIEDDWEHFCARSGLEQEPLCSSWIETLAWAKYAYFDGAMNCKHCGEKS